jgi:RNHCP domain
MGQERVSLRVVRSDQDQVFGRKRLGLRERSRLLFPLIFADATCPNLVHTLPMSDSASNAGRRFQRQVEDFICEHCGAEVLGNGYTNHCPKCLWSKHVDRNPGDRLERCQGMMEPVAVEVKAGEHIIQHCCSTCGFTRRQRSSDSDSFDALLQIAAQGRAK